MRLAIVAYEHLHKAVPLHPQIVTDIDAGRDIMFSDDLIIAVMPLTNPRLRKLQVVV